MLKYKAPQKSSSVCMFQGWENVIIWMYVWIHSQI